MLREARPSAENWPGLTLEVTEDQIIHDLQLAKELADALRELKCDLAVDDFGAGYSSFARLTQLPFSELKIDRAYVANCNRDQFNAGLCETIVELGRHFGLRTVAEGIETAHESHKLQSIGCQVGQGVSVRQADAEAPARDPPAKLPERPGRLRDSSPWTQAFSFPITVTCQ